VAAIRIILQVLFIELGKRPEWSEFIASTNGMVGDLKALLEDAAGEEEMSLRPELVQGMIDTFDYILPKAEVNDE